MTSSETRLHSGEGMVGFEMGAFDSDEGWSFDRRPITDAGNEAVIAEILFENSRGVFGGQVG